MHGRKNCLINQREVHVHTKSFANALRAALREDPDIVLVGEMRDLETIAIAIETAETGHLVFGTLHTTTAASTVDRVIDQFPGERQPQIRAMLSSSLKGVIAQTLCKRADGKGRVAAMEVLLVNAAISNLIREGKIYQIPSIMQTARGTGMIMLNEALFKYVAAGIVTPEEAYIKAVDKTGYLTLLKQASIPLDLSHYESRVRVTRPRRERARSSAAPASATPPARPTSAAPSTTPASAVVARSRGTRTTTVTRRVTRSIGDRRVRRTRFWSGLVRRGILGPGIRGKLLRHGHVDRSLLFRDGEARRAPIRAQTHQLTEHRRCGGIHRNCYVHHGCWSRIPDRVDDICHSLELQDVQSGWLGDPERLELPVLRNLREGAHRSHRRLVRVVVGQQAEVVLLFGRIGAVVARVVIHADRESQRPARENLARGQYGLPPARVRGVPVSRTT